MINKYLSVYFFSESVVTSLLLIVIGINVLGGIVGGIWLALTGGIGIIIFSFVAAFIMPWAYAIATLPSTGLAFLGAILIEKSKIFSIPFLLLAALYEKFVTALWVIWVFGYFVSLSGEYSIWPLLLVGYSTTMAPLSYMAKGESADNSGTTMALFFAQIIYLGLVVSLLLGLPYEIGVLVFLAVYLFFAIYPIAMLFKKDPNYEREIPTTEENIIKDTPLIENDNSIQTSGESPLNRQLKMNSVLIEKTLEAFGIFVRASKIYEYKQYTKYCFDLSVGTSIDKINKRAKDIALAVASPSGSVTIQAPIPGMSLVGIIVPKSGKSQISLKAKSVSIIDDIQSFEI